LGRAEEVILSGASQGKSTGGLRGLSLHEESSSGRLWRWLDGGEEWRRWFPALGERGGEKGLLQPHGGLL
jgi:hypothetical protein